MPRKASVVIIRDERKPGWFILRAGRVEYKFNEEYVEIVEYEEGVKAVLRTRAGYTIYATPYTVEWVPPASRRIPDNRGTS